MSEVTTCTSTCVSHLAYCSIIKGANSKIFRQAHRTVSSKIQTTNLSQPVNNSYKATRSNNYRNPYLDPNTLLHSY